MSCKYSGQRYDLVIVILPPCEHTVTGSNTQEMRIIVATVLLELFVVAHADIGCYVRGECIQSPTIESVEASSANECLSFCKVSDELFYLDIC